MTLIKRTLLVAFILLLSIQNAAAHCEIPCGIYNDSLRISLLYEHITTIEKSMKQIMTLEKSGKTLHQSVRWITNKEEHAEKMQEIVAQYFMHQRIKPINVGDDGRSLYLRQLELLHRLSVLAMKSKQGVSPELITQMRETLHLFEHAYFGEKHKH